jgi:dTDP-4-amino-4,6-dideoxygalactose transaminase
MLLNLNITKMTEARPRIPIAPVLSRASFSRGPAALPSILDAGQVRLVSSGRIAIAMALREMKVGPGDEVLVPAYHSLSMIPPVLWRGATPVFYRVGPGAAADLGDAAAKVTPATRAIMVTNYFGFPQDLAAVRAFCDARGLSMLEDCAHAFFGHHEGRALGSFGDYAIGSSMKFFPTYEGGALVSARHSLAAVTLEPGGVGFEAKAALAALESSFAYRRLPLVHAVLRLPLWLKDRAWGAFKRSRSGAAPVALAPSSSDSGVEFEPHWIGKRSSLFSRAVMALASKGRIAALRRKHYLVLEEAARGLPGVRPLFGHLPDGVVPWQFPLLADDPEPLFDALHAAGVPVVRFASTLWPGVDQTTCANSVALSRKVLALPCHQELHADELAWIAAQLRKALE